MEGTGFSPYINSAKSAGLYRLRKNSQEWQQASGHDFSRAVSHFKSIRALAPAACFPQIPPEPLCFSAACLAPEGMLRAPSFRFLSGERVGIHKADWRSFNKSSGGPANQLPPTRFSIPSTLAPIRSPTALPKIILQRRIMKECNTSGSICQICARIYVADPNVRYVTGPYPQKPPPPPW
jgi:hypothetical protein